MEGEANKPSGFHPVNSAKVSEGGQPLPDLWKHAEVGTTGSNQEKIWLATGSQLLVNVCNVRQCSPFACLPCSLPTHAWSWVVQYVRPFYYPYNQDNTRSRAPSCFISTSWKEPRFFLFDALLGDVQVLGTVQYLVSPLL